MKPAIGVVALGIAWAVAVASGALALARHNSTPGAAASGKYVDINLVTQSTVRSTAMTLIMFVHPKCTCSAASLEELSNLMHRCGNRLHGIVVMFQPIDKPIDWSHTTSWDAAASISGVEVRSDVGAALARKCGAQTSGQVFLYDTAGQLIFQGGITGSRGHVGDNDGLETVTQLVFGKDSTNGISHSSPVFGCPIYSTKDEQ